MLYPRNLEWPAHRGEITIIFFASGDNGLRPGFQDPSMELWGMWSFREGMEGW